LQLHDVTRHVQAICNLIKLKQTKWKSKCIRSPHSKRVRVSRNHYHDTTRGVSYEATDRKASARENPSLICLSKRSCTTFDTIKVLVRNHSIG